MTHCPTARHTPEHSEASAGTRSPGRTASSSQNGTYEAASPLKGTLQSPMLFQNVSITQKLGTLLLLLCSQTAGKLFLLPLLP